MAININSNNPAQNFIKDDLLQSAKKGEAEVKTSSAPAKEVEQPVVATGNIKTSSAAENVLARLKEQMSADSGLAMAAQAGSITRDIPSLI